MDEFHGQPVLRLSSRFLELDCLSAAGPRIVRLRYKGSPNLLAEVPHGLVNTPYGEYRFMGGHRLWHAPESMPRSYIPDGEGLSASPLPDGVLLDARTEPGSGIHKRMEIHLHPDQPRVTLSHTLVNEGLWEVKLAPWAITMMRLGGVAVLPTRAQGASADGLLPDRHICLWPYSGVHDPRVQIDDGVLIVRALPGLPLFKIGTFNPAGWTAYWLDNVLFRKSYAAQPGLRYPDLGCNAEIYIDENLIELESLGPLTKLAPGQSVQHTETWELFDSPEQAALPDEVVRLLG